MRWWLGTMSKKQKSKNDDAWEKLFSKYNILNSINSDGQFFISADQIREYREPRLMAKFDHHINLPQIFSENGLSILPVSRGDYVISHFDAYRKFDVSNSTIVRSSIPAHLQSLDASNIPSEAISINCALASGILSDFLGEEELTATVSGRMSSGFFDFNIQNNNNGLLTNVNVANSQIEIDAAFEGISSLALLEAKRDISEDFLVRQLYYPYRVWSSRITKPVRPVFLVFSNGVFSLYEYAFKNPLVYNSLELVQQKNYSIEDTSISIQDLQDVLNNCTTVTEPSIPFPQADSFKRIVNLCELLFDSPMTRDQVTEKYAFDIRQTNYYTDACRYLGLLEKDRNNKKITYKLTDRGNKIMSVSYRQRQLELCRCILEHKAFKDTFALYLQNGSTPTKDDVVQIMKQSNLYNIDGESTFYRRSSTLVSWLNWILDLAEE